MHMSIRLSLTLLLSLACLLGCRFAYADAFCFSDQGCQRIAAIGHGLISEDSGQPLAQRQLLAIRAAKVDALRALAEQVRGLRIQSETSSDGYGAVSDRIQTHLDTVLHGIRYVKVEPVDAGIYQALVEIDIQQ